MPFKPHPDNPDLVIYNPNEYWIPKPWVGLTDEEVASFENAGVWGEKDIRAIESKLKEKNGG